MRNIVYSTNISLDGYCNHDFSPIMPDGEFMEYFTNLMHDADLLVYGRITYQMMVPYWPDVAKAQSGTKAENEFAQALANLDKVVFSRTLKHAEENTKIIAGNLEEEVLKLKNQPGKNISIGGIDLPSQLMALGLVDEFNFLVHPVIAGKGRRLFEDRNLPEALNLKLIESRNFKAGFMALHYVKQ